MHNMCSNEQFYFIKTLKFLHINIQGESPHHKIEFFPEGGPLAVQASPTKAAF